MALTKLQEEYCKMNGWEKQEGILLDIEAIDDDKDKFFIPGECKNDYYMECMMWIDTEGNDEGVFDDGDIIEHIEDFTGLNFKEWKKRKEESSQ